MQIRTFQSSGTLLFSGSTSGPRSPSGVGHGADFIAVQLVNGRPRYVIDTGDGPQQITLSEDQMTPINDGRWHTVQVVRAEISTREGTVLIVDGVPAHDKSQSTTLTINTTDNEEVSCAVIRYCILAAQRRDIAVKFEILSDGRISGGKINKLLK